MIKLSYDQKRNTIIMEYSGKVDPVETERCFAELQQMVSECDNGFKLLTDLSGVEGIDPKIKSTIKKMMDLLNKQGVAEIVRVIPDPAQDIGLNIMSLFHYSKDVTFLTVPTREEAEARL